MFHAVNCKRVKLCLSAMVRGRFIPMLTGSYMWATLRELQPPFELLAMMKFYTMLIFHLHYIKVQCAIREYHMGPRCICILYIPVGSLYPKSALLRAF